MSSVPRAVWSASAGVLVLFAGQVASVNAQPPAGPPVGGAKEPPDFPEFAEITKGFEKVVSTSDGAPTMYTLYRREKDQRLLAELPRDFDRQKIYVATTVSGGMPYAGIQLGETYGQFRRYEKRLALMAPNTEVRALGDAESKRTEERLYTDRVIVDVPILGFGPGGGPIIELNELLVQNSEKFFGQMSAGANKRLLKIAKSKAFPKNTELAFEIPARDGTLFTMYYSISLIEGTAGYQPRMADPRIGFFTTWFRDISRQDKDTQWVRYINRWDVQKRDPKLAMSPPKQPIVFYLENNIPVHYRRWVRDGVLAWNKAFEKVGIVDAIEVYQQDAQSGTHMDKDPEDVRFNFIRWTSADLGFAIGPSRVNPETGQILDADVVMDDGFLRGWARQYNELLPETAMLGYGPDVLSWFDSHPQWDPRVRMAAPAERDLLLQQRALNQAKGAAETARAVREGRDTVEPLMQMRSGEPLMFGAMPSVPSPFLAQKYQGRCAAMLGKALDIQMMRTNMLALELVTEDDLQPADEAGDGEKKDENKDAKKDEKKDKKPKTTMIDGLPEWFVGPALRDVIMHEVGHTLGLRHNYSASSIYTIQQINSEEWKGKKAITGSVMDYSPLNINYKDGSVQGDFNMIDPGPYDYWAIEYGYTTESDLKPILARVGEAELPYSTDEDTIGPDPYAKQFDMGKDSLDYADSTMRLVQSLRPKILDKVVKPGDSWQKARNAYSLLLNNHIRAVRIAAWHIGGATVVRDRKGDPGNRNPITPTDMKQQRRALKFVMENAFRDEAFGLTRELLSKLTVDKWSDPGGSSVLFADPALPVHDRILGVQSSALTMLLNPTTLQRVYDNEFRIAPDQDALTLPEMLDTISAEIFSELDGLKSGTPREPSISSLRRNLQREYLNRLIDLSLPDAGFAAAYKPISNLVVAKLRDLKAKLDDAKDRGSLDAYTKAHLGEASIRIAKALDAQYIYNTDKIGFNFPGFLFFGEPTPETGAGRDVPRP